MGRITKEKFKVYKNVFDNFTEQTLNKLSSQGHFEELKSPIFVGKESNVFLASKRSEFVIVKIYRLESCDFNKMFDYIKSDIRYPNIKKQRRRVIFAWVQREYRNLMIAREGKVNVPTPLIFLNNILVLQLIGDNAPAPRLKDKIPKNKKLFFKKVLENMKKLNKAGLVHGDLSEYNILNYREEPYFIDFSQSTLIKNPGSEELLKRDVKNIARYFKKIGLETSEAEIIEKIKCTNTK
ncbi:MAG: serine protein kinase RIO [Candidatus Woesearchaeota archaeon]